MIHRTAVLLLLAASLPGQVVGQTMRFVDHTESAGIALNGSGKGLAIQDYDGDGWMDVYVASSQGASGLFRNRGDGSFEDASAMANLTLSGSYSTPLWGDLDGDGLVDLYVGGHQSEDRVFRNRGDGTFEEVSESSGIVRADVVGSAALADYDDDGRVDLFVAVDLDKDRLYRNVSSPGAIRFEEATDRQLEGEGHEVAMQPTWFDYDHDGDQDLLVVHDGFDRNRFYANRGFEGLAEVARTIGIEDIGVGNSMGVTWGDFDGDGWEDVYVTRIGEGGLFRNRGDGTFESVPDAAGAERNGMSWGTVFADFDNDLDTDLFIVNESGFDHTKSLLYENRNGAFRDIAPFVGAAFSVNAQGLAQADVNRDGNLDLLFPTADGAVRVLLGATENPGNWLSIGLRSTRPNSTAIGARVEIEVSGRTLTRWVSGGDSYCSQSSPRVHVGLGRAERVDAIRVFWGSGRTDTFGALAANGFVDLTEGTSTASEAAPGIGAPSPPYPNPTTGKVRLDLTPRVTSVEVYDVLGRRVATPALAGTDAEFNLSGLPAGRFWIRVVSDDTPITYPIMFVRP